MVTFIPQERLNVKADVIRGWYQSIEKSLTVELITLAASERINLKNFVQLPKRIKCTNFMLIFESISL